MFLKHNLITPICVHQAAKTIQRYWRGFAVRNLSSAGRRWQRVRAQRQEQAVRAQTDAHIHGLATALNQEVHARSLLEDGIRFLWEQVGSNRCCLFYSLLILLLILLIVY
jgi:hypothetical protein